MFKDRFLQFVIGFLAGSELYGTYGTYEDVLEFGLPPAGHFHNDSVESRGMGRQDWRIIASAYLESRRLVSKFRQQSSRAKAT